MPKLEVFVSHLTVESKFVDLLRKRLDHDFIGLLSFFISSDATSIPVGSQWFQDILDGISRADLQFVICSPESVNRPWINYETGGARVRNVDIIPLCHSGIIPEQLPVPLHLSMGAVLTDPAGLEKLYFRISTRLGSALPNVDFQSLARDFQMLEEEYAAQRSSDAAADRTLNQDSIKNPHVLCVSSEQYLQLGFENQLEEVLAAFPEDLIHDRVLSSSDLEQVLSRRTEIVHIAAYVCPRSGELYFSPVELPLGTPASADVDVIRPEFLAMLLKDAQTRLVVIASGDSLALVTMLLPITNVIAPSDIVSSTAAASWVRTFYKTLRVKTLAEACEFANAKSHAPMRLLTQQITASAVKISWQDERKSGD